MDYLTISTVPTAPFIHSDSDQPSISFGKSIWTMMLMAVFDFPLHLLGTCHWIEGWQAEHELHIQLLLQPVRFWMLFLAVQVQESSYAFKLNMLLDLSSSNAHHTCTIFIGPVSNKNENRRMWFIVQNKNVFSWRGYMQKI